MIPADVRDRVRELTGRFLADAAAVDASGVLPVEHLSGLAAAGLYGIFAPQEAGGLGLDFPDVCSVVEELASGCLASAFVWIQHFGPLRALLDLSVPERLRRDLLPGAVRGDVRGGVALAGLLPGPPRLSAVPVPGGGWRLDGEAPWVSGWGHVNVLMVAARGPSDSSVVRFLIDAVPQDGLAAERLRLAAADASATVRLTFSGLVVPADRCLGQQPFDPVRQQAEGLRSNGSLALGVARRCCALLGPSALDGELEACRAELDAAALGAAESGAAGTSAAGTGAMPAARAHASELAVRAAHVLAVSRGSRSALAGDDADRLTREAAFLLVFGSRPAIKQELLARLSGPSGR